MLVDVFGAEAEDFYSELQGLKGVGPAEDGFRRMTPAHIGRLDRRLVVGGAVSRALALAAGLAAAARGSATTTSARGRPPRRRPPAARRTTADAADHQHLRAATTTSAPAAKLDKLTLVAPPGPMAIPLAYMAVNNKLADVADKTEVVIWENADQLKAYRGRRAGRLRHHALQQLGHLLQQGPQAPSCSTSRCGTSPT